MKRKIETFLSMLVLTVAFTMLVPMVSTASTKGAKAMREYNSHYYAIFDDADSWKDAQAKCKKKGGHLVTVTSAAENKAVFQLVKKYNYDGAVAIGLYNAGTVAKPKWKWVTGEKVAYTNWQTGEPNGQGGNEFYAMYYLANTWKGKWNDGTNVPLNVYICEWDYSLQLADAQLELGVNHSTYIDYVITGNKSAIKNKTVTFNSSNTKVATVTSKGKVVAKSAGTATITCKVGVVTKSVKLVVTPDKVKNVTVASKTKNSIKLKWKGQQGVTKYEVYMYDRDLEEYTKVKTVDGAFKTATITGLKKNTTYKFKLRAYVKSGSKKAYGDFSKVLSIKTKTK